jgi:hypothetical protein
VIYSHLDPGFCTQCTIYIGVFSHLAGHPYTLTASTSASLNLLPDDQSFEDVVARDRYAYFELPTSTANKFTVEVEPCNGNVVLFSAFNTFYPNIDGFDARQPAENAPFISPPTLQVKRPSFDSAVFFGVYGVGTFGDPDVSFVIRSFVKTSMPAHFTFSSKTIDIAPVGNGKVELSFDAVTTAPVPLAQVTYEVYMVPTSSDSVMYTECGIAQPDVKQFATVTGATAQAGRIAVEVDGLTKGETYKFNVIVSSDSNTKALYDAVSTKVSPNDVGGNGISMKYILGIGIPVFIVIVAVVVYLCLRNRKLSKELQIEMHDVPKAVLRKAVRGPAARATGAGKAAKKYSRLLNEDDEGSDEDGVGTEYAPPDI